MVGGIGQQARRARDDLRQNAQAVGPACDWRPSENGDVALRLGQGSYYLAAGVAPPLPDLCTLVGLHLSRPQRPDGPIQSAGGIVLRRRTPESGGKLLLTHFLTLLILL